MRSQDDFLGLAERVIGRQRLLLIHIQCRTADLPRFHGLEQHRLGNQSAPGAVHNLHALATQLDSLLVENPFGLVGHRQVQGEKIAMGQQVLDPVGQLHLQAPGPRHREIGIVRHHPHSKSDRTAGHLPADPAHAQNAQCLAVEFGTLKTFPVPLPGGHRGVGLGQMTSQPQQKGESLFGRAHRVARRGVHDNDPPLRGGIHIHVVHPHPGPAYGPHRGAGLEDCLAHLGLAANHQGITALELFAKILFLERRTFDHLDLRTGFEHIDPAG